MGNYIKWKEKDLKNLKENYEFGNKEDLIKLLDNRKWSAITKKASVLNLKRKVNEPKSSLEILLEDSVESYYWIGFLMADAHFSDRSIKLKVSKDDNEHVLKFKQYINSKNKISYIDNCCRISLGNKKVVDELKKKFSITSKKTYEPCEIKKIKDDDLFFSLFVGFIDGDGSIIKNGKRNQIMIHSHESWIDNFQYISNRIYDIFEEENPITSKIEIRKANNYCTKESKLASLKFSKSSLIKKIENKSIELMLPKLERKWKKIIL